ncbi:hypothetical protein MHYP_G00079060 [Metynnis hypsauchen]
MLFRTTAALGDVIIYVGFASLIKLQLGSDESVSRKSCGADALVQNIDETYFLLQKWIFVLVEKTTLTLVEVIAETGAGCQKESPGRQRYGDAAICEGLCSRMQPLC